MKLYGDKRALRLSTQLFKQGERFVVGVVGVHLAGPIRFLFEYF